MTDLTVRSTAEGDATRLSLAGDLDIAAAEPLEEAVTAALADGARTLLIDLTSTTLVDSTGLSHLFAARRDADAAHAGMRVLAPPGSEARVVIGLAGVGAMLGLEPASRPGA